VALLRSLAVVSLFFFFFLFLSPLFFGGMVHKVKNS
jgi:hypothetical protein